MRAFLLSFLVLSACTPAFDGHGDLNTGVPITGLRTIADYDTEIFEVSSADGWSCRSVVDYANSIRRPGNTRVSVPITCSDGATGTATIIYPHWSRNAQIDKVRMTFKLQDGRSGGFIS